MQTSISTERKLTVPKMFRPTYTGFTGPWDLSPSPPSLSICCAT